MTRLLGIILLISPLWAIDVNLVQEMQQARALMVKIYYQAFKERCERVESDMLYSNAMQKEAPTLVKHLKAFVNHIPLLQAFQPKTPKQAQMIQALKALEMFNLFTFLRTSIPDIDDCKNSPERPERVYPFNAQKNALEFLKGIELMYASLLEAYHQGLDITDYLQALQTNLDLPNSNTYLTPSKYLSVRYLSGMETQEDILNMTKGAKTPTMRHYFKDIKSIKAQYDSLDSLYEIFHPEYDQNFLQTQIMRSTGVKVQDLEVWTTYYKARVLAFLGDYENQYDSNMENYWRAVSNVHEIKNPSGVALFVVVRGLDVYAVKTAINGMKTAMQMILPKYPTPCLQPQYLNQEAKATCLQIFKQHTYNPKPLQKYLNSLRLISIDNAPCVYLNSKDKLQSFKSDNAICLALQKNLEKGLK
ncbi:hypothetical protein [Helicobacter salomonis]|uniref:hypothetical protein n=1 Tax=Helicobacter salomonis TaxID=56878 RepID=UPI001F202BA2|nr:hypothetical protein [Helicobacter salomonis]